MKTPPEHQISTKPPPPAPDGQRVLTVSEAAALFHVTEQHIQNMIDSGELEAINLGIGPRKMWRIPPEAIAAFRKRASSLNLEGSQ